MAEAGGQQWQRRTSRARRVMLQRLGMRASFSKPQRDGLCDQGADERLLKSQLSMRCALFSSVCELSVRINAKKENLNDLTRFLVEV